MRCLEIEIAGQRLSVAAADSSHERRQGMRMFPGPRPLLLSGAPLIHTWGCPALDLVWIRKNRVWRVCRAAPRKLYFAPAWHCLELPEGALDRLAIKKGDPVFVLGES